MTAPAPVPVSQRLTCRHCGEVFTPPVWKNKVPENTRSHTLVHADHETTCPKNPDHRGRVSKSTAWKPEPWRIAMTSAVTPTTGRVVFVGGPYHGRIGHWEWFLVDGTRLQTPPMNPFPGPVTADSAGRAVSKYMGRYDLFLTPDGAPYYRWVDTPVPKARLPKATTFTEAWPELAATLPVVDLKAAPELKEETDDLL